MPPSIKPASEPLPQHDPFYFGELFDPDGTYVSAQPFKGWEGGTATSGTPWVD